MKKLAIILMSLATTVAVAQNTPSAGKAKVPAKTNQSSLSSTESKAILAVIDTYIKGLRLGRVDLLKEAFYKDAIMYGFSEDEKITEGSVQHLYDIIEKHGALSKVTSRNSILHRTSNTASVLAELTTTATNQNSTDYLSLMKINGQWKIISKVYHLSAQK